MVSAKAAAAAGVAAALVGLAAGELMAAMVDPDTSPVVVVGAQVIDLTPTPLKEWAVARFGSADKVILVSSVVAVVLAAAAGAGWLTARRGLLAGALAFGGLAAIAGAIAVRRPGNSVLDAAPAAVTALAALVALAVMTRTTAARSTTAGGRRVLLQSVFVLLLAGAMESTAQRVVGRRAARSMVELPKPRIPVPDLPAGLTVPGITPFRTSARDFYRVDTRLTLPTIDVDNWRLRIDGQVDRTASFSFDDIAAMDLIERDITLTCVSNEVGGRYVGAARWLGVPLADLLDRAGVRNGADQILSTDVDGMTISTPLSIAMDGRDSMIAIGMNGEPLPRAHGFPARLVVPGLYGFVGATKWITRMTLTTYAEQDAYWTKRGWATDAPIKPSSRIDTPRPFQTLPAGEQVTIGGIAWAQNSGGVAGVEVSIDDGPWLPAVLGPSGGANYWRQWFVKWTATTGRHTVAARAIAANGRSQSARRETPFPSGASGIQRLVLNVA